MKREEYDEFFKSLTHDTDPPAAVIHYAAEGKTEFKVLAFIPAKKPFSYDWQEPVTGLRLYVQRVLIMDRCEQVLPFHLRFVQGVVDSSDLPLNVSRELLQQNPLLDVIQKSVVKNVLDTLAGMKNVEFDKYLEFYRGFGPILKEGLARDWTNREKIADLLLFESANTEPGKFTTLEEYVAKMPEGQSEIYYLIGDSAEQLRRSPYLEAFKAKGRDVLLLSDPIDEFAIPGLPPTRRSAPGRRQRRYEYRRCGPAGDGREVRGPRRRYEGQTPRGGRRAAHRAPDRERCLPCGGRGGGERSHGTVDGTDGSRRGGGQARVGTQSEQPRRGGTARPPCPGRSRSSYRGLRPTLPRPGGGGGGFHGLRPGCVRATR